VNKKIDQVLANEELKRHHELATGLRNRLRVPTGQSMLWAKFPGISQVWTDPQRDRSERDELRKLFKTQFRPGFRHEAATALAAWRAMLSERNGMTALAVYLIASHHGKVRTVLRRLGETDEAFGLTKADVLLPVPGYF
jgi:hypothetical protein